MFTDYLKSFIKIKGPLTIAEFMQEALFNPLHGYYQKKIPIGKDGDFTTAPEISQVFGELIGLYFLNLASNAKKPIALVEMGAGKGNLFKDLLLMIKKLADKNIAEARNFLQKTTFNIVEISPALQKLQQENLAEIAAQANIAIKWHVNFQCFLAANEKCEIYFVANELFDCFPINQFVKTSQGWCEKVIGLQNEELSFFIENFNPLKNKIVEELVIEKTIKDQAVFEYSFFAANFMQELSQSLQSQGGIALIIDYGYIENAFKSTLQALKNHQFYDCLKTPGEADITALVDFYLLTKIAQKSSLNFSLVSQKEFLAGLGIEERRKALLAGKNNEAQNNINSAINRLIDPLQMGELFKCLIIWK